MNSELHYLRCMEDGIDCHKQRENEYILNFTQLCNPKVVQDFLI